eukprot:366092-Chlamydomonas_euryale.AAC.18
MANGVALVDDARLLALPEVRAERGHMLPPLLLAGAARPPWLPPHAELPLPLRPSAVAPSAGGAASAASDAACGTQQAGAESATVGGQGAPWAGSAPATAMAAGAVEVTAAAAAAETQALVRTGPLTSADVSAAGAPGGAALRAAQRRQQNLSESAGMAAAACGGGGGGGDDDEHSTGGRHGGDGGSSGREGEGLTLVCFASNLSGTRRYLFSRSGHIFVARGGLPAHHACSCLWWAASTPCIFVARGGLSAHHACILGMQGPLLGPSGRRKVVQAAWRVPLLPGVRIKGVAGESLWRGRSAQSAHQGRSRRGALEGTGCAECASRA